MAASFQITHYRFAWASEPANAITNWLADEDTSPDEWPFGIPLYFVFQLKNTGDAAGYPHWKLHYKLNGTLVPVTVRDSGPPDTDIEPFRTGWLKDDTDITAAGHQLSDEGTLAGAIYMDAGIIAQPTTDEPVAAGETYEVVLALSLNEDKLAWADVVEPLLVHYTTAAVIPAAYAAAPEVTVASWYTLTVPLAAKADDAGDVNTIWQDSWPYVQYEGAMRWQLPTLPRNATIKAATVHQHSYTSSIAGAFPWSVGLIDAKSCPDLSSRHTAAPYATVPWYFDAPGADLDSGHLIPSPDIASLVQSWLRGRGEGETPATSDYLGLHFKLDGSRTGHFTTKTADYITGMADAPALYVAYTLPQLTVRERIQVKPPRGWVLGNDGRPIDPVMRGIEGLWLFNEGTGDLVADCSGHGRHGTAVNGPAWQAGHTGWRLSCDGVNDYVEAPVPISVWAADYTVCLRVAQQPYNNYDGIFGVVNAAGDGVAIRCISGLAVDGIVNSWAHYNATPAAIATAAIASDTGWHTVVGGVAGVKTYISRDAAAPTLSGGSLLTRTAPATTCVIGASVSSSGGLLYARCQIDWAAIWSRVLSAAEVKRLHENPPWLLH